MKRKLLTVEDRFQISGRGLAVVPGPLLDEFPGPVLLTVELRRPDGTTLVTQLWVHMIFADPPARTERWACLLRSVSKDDVPIGTEVWIDDAAVAV